MLTIEFNPKNLADRPELDVGKLREQTKRRMLELALRWAELTKANLSGKVLHVQTGALRSSIGSDVAGDERGYTVRVFSSNVPYAAIHEYGGVTKPHDIFPVKAKALHFMIGAKDVFARSVHHPGSRIPERSYIRSALIEALSSMGVAPADQLYDLFDSDFGLADKAKLDIEE